MAQIEWTEKPNDFAPVTTSSAQFTNSASQIMQLTSAEEHTLPKIKHLVCSQRVRTHLTFAEDQLHHPSCKT